MTSLVVVASFRIHVPIHQVSAQFAGFHRSVAPSSLRDLVQCVTRFRSLVSGLSIQICGEGVMCGGSSGLPSTGSYPTAIRTYLAVRGVSG